MNLKTKMTTFIKTKLTTGTCSPVNYDWKVNRITVDKPATENSCRR